MERIDSRHVKVREAMSRALEVAFADYVRRCLGEGRTGVDWVYFEKDQHWYRLDWDALRARYRHSSFLHDTGREALIERMRWRAETTRVVDQREEMVA